MFTGIVTEVGRVTATASSAGVLRLTIEARASARGLALGGSVAVSGVCLTAVSVTKTGFTVQVVPETARRSTLGSARKGTRVNLERPLKASQELGGHFVQGHVDARARVEALNRVGKEVLLGVELPEDMAGLVVPKGSIAIDGVSLTVIDVSPGRKRTFRVALIPHTLKETTLGGLRAGTMVNLEADILGKYVRELLAEGR